MNTELRTSKSSTGHGSTFVVRSSAFEVRRSDFLLLESGPCPPAFNMALDEALLEAIGTLGLPVLRCYGWTEPAASFGYFQPYAEVERATRLRPLIRRPTGGGIVPHDADWTYSLAFPPAHEWYSLRATDSYRRVHAWVRDAFARLGMETKLAVDCCKSLPGQCFAGHERFDVLCQGRKIAGAAQRRNKLGLLIQGSVQPPGGICRSDWEQAFAAVAVELWRVDWRPLSISGGLQCRAEQLVREKYGCAEYNRRR